MKKQIDLCLDQVKYLAMKREKRVLIIRKIKQMKLFKHSFLKDRLN